MKRLLTLTLTLMLVMLMSITNILAAPADTLTFNEDFTVTGGEDLTDFSYDGFESEYKAENGTYALADVTYDVKTKTPLTGQISEYEVTYSDLTEKNANPEEKIEYELDGKKYIGKLRDTTYTEVEVEGISVNVSGYTEFPAQVTEPKYPNTKNVSYKDPVSEKDKTLLCSYNRIENTGFRWIDDLSLTVTVRDYDSLYYTIGKEKIHRDDILDPVIVGQAILADASLSADNYKILKLTWDGEEYTDGNGTICRKITATGERYVTDYRVFYTGTTTSDKGKGYTAVAVYDGTEILPTDAAYEYVVTATATYELTEPVTDAMADVTEPDNTLPVKAIVAITGISLLAVIIVVGIIFITVHKKNQKNN